MRRRPSSGRWPAKTGVMMPDPRPLIFVELIARGADDPEARAWLEDGLRTWLRADCAIDLQTVLRLPRTPAGAARARRDFWLREAAVALDGDPCAWARARRILRAVVRLSYGLPTDEPPAVDDALRRALAADVDLPPTIEGIRRIVGASNKKP